MTRTERSVSPRAIIKDRHESKTGQDRSMRKNGGGQHNWGSLQNEREYEEAAARDEDMEPADELVEEGEQEDTVGVTASEVNIPSRRMAAVSDEEKEQAREYRKTALKGNADLSEIARTSAGASSSPTTVTTFTSITSSNKV